MAPLQRELGHLALGKVLSTAMGLVVLALMWRRVEPQAYGQYLTLLAGLELLALGSALGLSTIAQRHLPIWMAHARTAARALGLVAQLMSLRALLGVLALGALGSLMFALPWPPAIRPTLPDLHWGLALGWFTAGVLVRSLEEIQSALLMQAWIQGPLVAGHAVRLVGLLSLPPQSPAGLAWLITLELGVALLTLVAGVVALVLLRVRGHGRAAEDPLRQEAPSHWVQAWRQALGFWTIQCLGMAWSLHTLRLVLHAALGPTAVAVQAAAQALGDSLRQASPLVWMAGWLRAAMLRLHAVAPSSKQDWHLALAVQRATAVLLWPVLAAWCAEPAVWLRWAAGPMLYEEAQAMSLAYPGLPPFTLLLVAASVLVPLQNRHLLLSLWAQTRQRPGWGLVASVAALTSVLSLPWVLPVFGLWSVPLVMIGAECVWVGIVMRQASAVGFSGDQRMAVRAVAVPVGALSSAFAAAAGWDFLAASVAEATFAASPLNHPLMLMLMPCLAAALAVVVLTWKWPAWSSAEREALWACLPQRWRVRWRQVWCGASA